MKAVEDLLLSSSRICQIRELQVEIPVACFFLLAITSDSVNNEPNYFAVSSCMKNGRQPMPRCQSKV
jgi:hypothetical protein